MSCASSVHAAAGGKAEHLRKTQAGQPVIAICGVAPASGRRVGRALLRSSLISHFSTGADISSCTKVEPLDTLYKKRNILC